MGLHPTVDRSDSMAPTLRAGDLLLVRSIHATDARVGDVITFPDPKQAGQTITHRVQGVQRTATNMIVTTRGDANSADERWTIAPDATIGQYAGVRIPAIGRALEVVHDNWIATLLSGLILIAAASAAARVLRQPTATKERAA